MKRRGIHTVFFALTVILLALPAVQQHTRWFKLRPLNGVTVATEKPELSLKAFLSGDFQKQEDKYLMENIGFREFFVRCYNQMSWSMFRVPQNKTVRVGKENWLFDEGMVRHHDRQLVYDYGVSNEEVVRKTKVSAFLLCQLQEVLREYGVSLFVCLAPGKDVVCEEFLRQEKRQDDRPPGVRAMDLIPPLFDSLGVDYLDLGGLYVKMKDTVPYPLYLKTSFHWSLQSACHAADTLVRYMEALSGLNLHNLSFSAPYLAPTRNPDADLEELLNLMWPIGTRQNQYVDVIVDDDSTATKPRWLVVGDSYYWEWQYGLPMDQLFDTRHFWYYNSTIFNDSLHSNVSEVDILEELLSSNIITLLYSPNNQYDLNRGFLTNALLSLYFEDSVIEAKLGEIKQDIRNSPDWYAAIEQNALASGQEVEQALEDNARYMLMESPGTYFGEFNEARPATMRNSRVAEVLARVRQR